MAALDRQHEPLLAPLHAALERVVRSGRYVLGPELSGFERALAQAQGFRHVVGVSSGTDALLCALMALQIGPGDEVVTSPFTFAATASAIVRSGAKVVFADIEPEHFGLDPERLAQHVTPACRAILPVHLFGQPADVPRLMAAAPGVGVIEDCAQSLGATLAGRPVGKLGMMGCFSFFPAKVLGALGDAGAVVSDDAQLAERCRAIRSHGRSEVHVHPVLGGNFRMDELQAAFLQLKLPSLGHLRQRRRALAQRYTAAFADAPGLVRPGEPQGAVGAFSLYTVRVREGRRDALAAYLGERGIATAIHYPQPLYRQPCFAGHGRWRAEEFPETERACREVLSLPLFAELQQGEQDRVVESVLDFFGR